VNFVAHAVVAGGGDAVAFGAMVPDLRAFARGAPLPVEHPDLDEGIRSHHRVDAAFHASPVFASWMRTVATAMDDGRAARAAAHVAVELAIDGVLLARERAGAFYGAVDWAASAFDGPWLDVATRLGRDEVVDAYRSPAGVARRTVGAISRRPRLSRLALDEPALAGAVALVLPDIERDLDAVLAECA
jgi:hypothetical protein